MAHSGTFSSQLSDRMYQYARLVRADKPIGTALLLWPMLWALWFVSQGQPSWSVLIVFLCGTFLMRSAGCAINDFADRKIDGAVERTRNRPLVTGAVSAREAVGVAVVLSLLSFVLVLTMNRLTIMLSDGKCSRSRVGSARGVDSLCRRHCLGTGLRYHLRDG